MGYYSDFNGEYMPNVELTKEQIDKIRTWFVRRFGEYSITPDGAYKFDFVKPDGTTKWYNGAIVFDYNHFGNVIPVSSNMKGYYFNEHLYEFVEWMKANIPEVKYSGEVERIGEEFGDNECIRVENCQVKSYRGRIVWEYPSIVQTTEAQAEAAMRARFASIMKGVK